MTEDEIRYALAKQVPAMETEVILHTNYGEVPLYDEDAALVAILVRHLLQEKLRRLER